jgi:PAS domain S-box-containing protein
MPKMKKFVLISAGVVTLCLAVAFMRISFGPKKTTRDFLTSEERQWLKAHEGKITLAVERNYPPYSYVDSDGNIYGLSIDYIQLLEKKIGFKFNRRIINTLDEILQKARGGEVDIVNAVTRTPNRLEYLFFTSPYISVESVIIVRHGQEKPSIMETLTGKKVSMGKGYGVSEYVSRENPEVIIDPVPDDFEALKRVSFNQSDAAILDLGSASYLIERHGITNLHLAGDAGFTYDLSIACRKDYPELFILMQKAVRHISEGEIARIKRKWIRLGGGWTLAGRAFLISAGAIIGGLLLIAAGAVIWNRILHRKVSMRTAELALELAERKRTGEALRESEALLKEAQKLAHIGSWELNLMTNNLLWSEEVYRIFEIDPRQFGASYEAFLELVHPEDRERVNLDYTSSVKNKTPYEIVHRLLMPDGRVKFVQEHCHTFFDAQDRPLRSIGTVQDITERKQAEEERHNLQSQLIHSQKLESIGRLADSVAHDFNNFLTVILGCCGLLLSRHLDPEIREPLEQIRQTCQKIGALTRQLLTFSRKNIPEMKKVNLNQIITDFKNMLERLIDKAIIISTALDTALGLVNADPSQIEQILMNLAVNARDAMSQNGALTISTKNLDLKEGISSLHGNIRPGSYVLLMVGDTGCGMNAETQKHIFEPFFTTKEHGKGTGLGLSTVYSIVQQHGGHILFDSEVGKGTSFKIYLPRVQPVEEEQAEPQIPEGQGRGGETILLVEDDPETRSMICSTLTRYGYQVIDFGNPSDAIMLSSKAGHIDLLLTEMILPEMNGRIVYERVSAFLPGIKVLYFSGYHQDVIIHLGILDQGTPFLQKPFLPSQLVKRIRETLDGAA